MTKQTKQVLVFTVCIWFSVAVLTVGSYLPDDDTGLGLVKFYATYFGAACFFYTGVLYQYFQSPID